MTLNRFSTVVVITYVVLAGACAKQQPAPKSDLRSDSAFPLGPGVVARTGEFVITEAELQEAQAAYLRAAGPFVDTRYTMSPKLLRRYLVAERIRSEILGREALRLGLDKNPETQTQIKRALANLLQRKYESHELEPPEDVRKALDELDRPDAQP